jgi:uncharacterized membrane protein YeaQ/YmgE (transglycosylase-associated protein family)
MSDNITIGQLIVWLIVGALAGSLASRLITGRKKGYGFATNLVIGLVGALIGGALFSLLNVDFGLGSVAISGEDLLAAFIGSLIFLAVVRFLRDR